MTGNNRFVVEYGTDKWYDNVNECYVTLDYLHELANEVDMLKSYINDVELAVKRKTGLSLNEILDDGIS